MKKKSIYGLVVCFLSIILIILAWNYRQKNKPIVLEFGMFAESNWDVKNANAYVIIDDAIKKFEKELDIKKMANQYWYHYLEDYFFFKGKNGSSIYLRRMRKSLYRVFFILVKVKLFTTKEMLSVFIFLLSPNIYYKIFGKNLH